ncbi:N-alpha-acetyltransferase 80-like [Amphiura filiformis]|uniref:N-alpha-acetyltransferase 80-like n=1 Tax=Amphiura filiformis TaxID=82378 RepID=UPI003B2161E0
MTLQLVPLHSRLDLVQQCVSLLSDEWPSGKHERLEVIESNCPNPPCSLVLLSRQTDGADEVIGHCRIVPVKDMNHMLYVEQVVIEKAKRGRGFGKRLLEMVEDYCIQFGYKRLFLGTSPDTPKLYLRLGYRFTDLRPIVVGPGMLDYDTQVPLSIPYPGWEHFYKTYDGSVLSSSIQPVSQTSSQSSLHEGKTSLVSDAAAKSSRSNVEIPQWAMDVDGYCQLMKEISKDMPKTQ